MISDENCLCVREIFKDKRRFKLTSVVGSAKGIGVGLFVGSTGLLVGSTGEGVGSTGDGVVGASVKDMENDAALPRKKTRPQ